jgi:hypothetical protein
LLADGTNAAIAWATGVLAAATIALVAATLSLARHAGRANRDAAKPHMVLKLRPLSAQRWVIRASNIGLGAARSVQANLILHHAAAREERPWNEPVIEPGENHEFNLPSGTFDFATFAQQYPMIELSGTMRDTLGNDHKIQDVVDVEAYAAQYAALHERLPDNYEERLADALETIAQTFAHRKHFDRILDPMRAVEADPGNDAPST